MWNRPDFEVTLSNIVQSRILGVFRFEDCLSIYLDVDYLKSKGIYEEVKAHEETHLQLTTSTTIGHLLMFLAASRLCLVGGYREVYEGLIEASREAQEGAATLTEWCITQRNRLNVTEDDFIKTLTAQYTEPFYSFQGVSQIVLAPECYWMKPIVANALGQFCLNTDIIKYIVPLVEGKTKTGANLNNHLMSIDGHPQKRLRKIWEELADADTKKRTDRCIQMLERLKICWEKISVKFPTLVGDRHFISTPTREQWMLINDEINQAFLRYFVDITGLTISCYHSSDAGKQSDLLAEIFREKTGITISRNDMSNNIRKRAEFSPKIYDISEDNTISLF
jgi:hypothetical protein